VTYFDHGEDPVMAMLRHASKLRSEAQDHMITIAGGALAVTVTFRQAVTSGAGNVLLLKLSWFAFACSVIALVADKLLSSRLMTATAVAQTPLTRRQKLMLASLFGVTTGGFAVGIVALALFGLLNL
jgi:hypothetical protein